MISLIFIQLNLKYMINILETHDFTYNDLNTLEIYNFV